MGRYMILDPAMAAGGPAGWDRGVAEASEIYSHRIHNLFCDNCHSHVARALNIMYYDGSTSWNMVSLCFWMLLKGRHNSWCSVVKSWLPSLILVLIIVAIVLFSSLQ